MESMEVDHSGNVNIESGDLITIGDLFSEESSFNGNEETKAVYDRKVAAYNPRVYWDIRAWDLQCLTAIAAAKVAAKGVKRKREHDDKAEATSSERHVETSTVEKPSRKDETQLHAPVNRPYNPYEGEKLAKQLDESLDDFLLRLPPSTTDISSGPWIWIADPSSNYRPLNTNIGTFKKTAYDHMESYLSTKSQLEHDNPDALPATITRKLKASRDSLEFNILTLAKENGLKQGKWMLFLSPESVDKVWSLISRAILSSTLGPVAKVATNNPSDPRNNQKLLCIYTDDFSDIADVKRVLRELVKMKLVENGRNASRDGVIYYKCDAYTYVDIASGNEFKIRASMYNSNELFKEMKVKGEL